MTATITWTPDKLDRIAAADELDIAARRGDATLRKAVPIWVVRVLDAADHVSAAVDAAYRDK